MSGSETSNSGQGSEGAQGGGHWRVWIVALILCALITACFSVSVIRSHGQTRDSIDRLILNGPGSRIDRIMHAIKFVRKDGATLNVDVGGSASMEQVMCALDAFSAGDIDPAGWKVTEWVIADGSTIKVSTPPNAGEPEEKHCARHDGFVARLQERFPPIR